jgi:hypothetical protein
MGRSDYASSRSAVVEATKGEHAMSLSDRLAAAARNRGADDDGPLASRPTALRQVARPAEPPVSISVMLPPDGPVSIVDADPSATPGSLCPTCNRPGELGLVDLHRHTTDWQCTTCGTMWRATATTAAPAPLAAPGERVLPPMRG